MVNISIIIPVYNIDEDKLKRCFDSIYRQEYKDFEIIVVDDGSEKKCADFLQSCVGFYGFKLIQQSNKGVSAARNLGIEVSKGNYVMFVDGDDTLEIDCLNRFAELSANYEADVILGGINIIEGEKIINCGILGNEIILYQDCKIAKLQKYMLAIQCDKETPELNNLRCSGPWSKAIKRSAFDQVKFDEKLPVYEDLFFNLELLDEAKSVLIDNSNWYNYYIYDDSAMHKYRANGVQEQNEVIDSLLALKKHHDPSFGGAIALKTIECLRRLLSGTISCDTKNFHQKLRFVKKMFKDERVVNLLNGKDENNYPARNIKEKIIRTLFYMRSASGVSLLYCCKGCRDRS